MKPMTYDDWRAAGFQVRRGETAVGRNKAGKPVFTREQVDDAPERRNTQGDDQ